MCARRDKEKGSISVAVALGALCMIPVVGVAADFGGQAVSEQRARTVAAEAARAGGQRVQLDALTRGHQAQPDTVLAVGAAHEYLAQAGVSGSVSMAGNTITVNVTGSYDCIFLSILGVASLPVSGTASADVVRAFQGAAR